MKRTVLITIGVVLFIAGSYFTYLVSLGSSSAHVDGAKMLGAAQAYTRDLRAQGNAVPENVPMDILIQRGYLSRRDVRGFDGLEVSIGLEADETTPRRMLVKVRMPDGQEMAVLGDGSVQPVE